MAFGARTERRRGTAARRERVAQARKLRSEGKKWEEIGRALGVHATTAYYYVFPKERDVGAVGRPEFQGQRRRCHSCNRTRSGCVRFKGAWCCPECLTADEVPLSIDNFANRRHNERRDSW